RRILMWETYAEGYPLRKSFPLRGRFSRAEHVRQALNVNPEANYSLEELSIAESAGELPDDMLERRRHEQANRRARAGDARCGRRGAPGACPADGDRRAQARRRAYAREHRPAA